MTSVSVEPTVNFVTIEPTTNGVTTETFDVTTTYYFLQASQILPEHKEVDHEL